MNRLHLDVGHCLVKKKVYMTFRRLALSPSGSSWDFHYSEDASHGFERYYTV